MLPMPHQVHRLRTRHAAGLMTAVALMLIAACSRDPEPPQTVEERESQKAVQDEAAEAPPTRPLDSPPAEALGTVPPGHGLELGARVPEVSLRNADGERVELQELADGRAVLIGFYRGGWCPFCNTQVRQFAVELEAFEQRRITPILISVDQVSETAKTEAAYEIPFPILSDSELAAHGAFRVLFEVPEDEVERLRSMGMDLEAASGHNHNTLALPSLFLFDASGELLWQHVDADYKVRPRLEQILEVLGEHGFESGT